MKVLQIESVDLRSVLCYGTVQPQFSTITTFKDISPKNRIPVEARVSSCIGISSIGQSTGRSIRLKDLVLHLFSLFFLFFFSFLILNRGTGYDHVNCGLKMEKCFFSIRWCLSLHAWQMGLPHDREIQHGPHSPSYHKEPPRGNDLQRLDTRMRKIAPYRIVSYRTILVLMLSVFHW